MVNVFSDKSYTLSQVLICPAGGNQRSIDVMAQIVELTKFEDLFATTRAGELFLADAVDLIASIPLTGFDFLKLIYEKPNTTQGQLTEVYRIYKIDRRQVSEQNQTGQVYSLRFCSEELILSVANSISKSYKGKTVTQMVMDILQNELKVNSTKIPAKNFDQTQGVFNIIMPNFSPFRAINFAVQRSVPPAVFYENRDGFFLRTLNNLYSQAPVQQYRYDPQNVSTGAPGNVTTGLNRIITYEHVRGVDVMKGYTNGMFASRLETFDLIRWKNVAIDQRYADFYGMTKHLNTGGSFDPQFKDRLGHLPSDNKHAWVRFYPTNKDHQSAPYISSHQPNILQTLVENWFLQRQSVMEQIHYHKMKIVVPGTTAVTIGDVIQIGVPTLGHKFSDQDNLNPYYTGNYLITAIRHKFTHDHYEMVIEVSTDSWGQALVPANNTDPGLAQLKVA